MLCGLLPYLAVKVNTRLDPFTGSAAENIAVSPSQESSDRSRSPSLFSLSAPQNGSRFPGQIALLSGLACLHKPASLSYNLK